MPTGSGGADFLPTHLRPALSTGRGDEVVKGLCPQVPSPLKTERAPVGYLLSPVTHDAHPCGSDSDGWRPQGPRITNRRWDCPS